MPIGEPKMITYSDRDACRTWEGEEGKCQLVERAGWVAVEGATHDHGAHRPAGVVEEPLRVVHDVVGVLLLEKGAHRVDDPLRVVRGVIRDSLLRHPVHGLGIEDELGLVSYPDHGCRHDD